MRRAPRGDAAWRERAALHRVALERATEHPDVRDALVRADLGLAAFLDAPSEPTGETFWSQVRAVADACVRVVPALAELNLTTQPPSPLDMWVAAAVCAARAKQDERAAPWRDLLLRAWLHHPGTPALLPLRDLRAMLGVRRGPGQPAGRARSHVGWSDLPESLVGLLELLLPVVSDMARHGQRITLTTVCARAEIDPRRLREAFAHHGMDGRALMRTLQKATSRRR